MEFLFLVLGLIAGGGVVWFFSGRRRGSLTPMPTTPASTPARSSDPTPDVGGELERLRAALDALPVGVVYADASGRVVVRNRMAEHAAGARHGDILVEEAVEAHLGAASNGDERRQTLELFGPPAKLLAIHAQPVEGGGAIATIADVTERARLDAVRTDFVSNISHELKTPVGAISLLAETLADAEDAEVVVRLSGRIVMESERLAHTIDDLLELSSIELGGGGVRELIRTEDILEEAADHVRPLAERRQIRVRVIESSLSITMLGDRRQLVSALGNLIENAVKYSEPDNGVEVSASTEDTMVTFRVTDHGIGIPPQHLDRIFERFYRVDRARSRDTGGTGLGLAIVRHVATNHAGQVSVTSQEGEGSTFVLRIPAGLGPAAVSVPQEYPVTG